MGSLDVAVRPLDLLVDDAADGEQELLLCIGKVDRRLIGQNPVKTFNDFVRSVSNPICPHFESITSSGSEITTRV